MSAHAPEEAPEATAARPVHALALQTLCEAVNGLSVEDARSAILSAIGRIGREIAGSKAFIGPDLELVVLPEYALTSFPMGEDAALWKAKAALDPDGREYAALGELAAKHGLWLGGNAYETDRHFPELYFQACFLFGPDGKRHLTYRRLVSMYAPSPYDVLDRYLDAYGAGALFPVAHTPIGRIAAIASEEILYPEIARAHALRGAEIFIHPTSEVSSPLPTPKNIAKQARAIENLAYVVSANTAGISDTPIPQASADRGSKIVDPRGLVLAEAATGPSMTANAEIDAGLVRRMRRRVAMGNLLARTPSDLWAQAYASAPAHPANTLLDGDAVRTPGRDFYRERQAKVIAALGEKGVI